MGSHPIVGRRALLQAGCVAGVGALAGCAGGSGDEGDGTTPEEPIADVGGSFDQYLGDAGNTSRIDGSLPEGPLEKRWSADVDVRNNREWAFALVDGSLYFVDDTSVTALDAATGAVEWEWTAPEDPEGDLWNRTVAVASDTVLVSHAAEVVYSLDRATGEANYRLMDTGGGAAVTLADGEAYLGTKRGVLVFDPASGEQRALLSDGVSGVHARPPAVTADYVVTSGSVRDDGGDLQQYVVAFDRESGEQAWQTDPNPELPVTWPVAADGGMVVAVGLTEANAFALEDGRTLWRWNLEEFEQFHGPGLGPDGVYVARDRLWKISRDSGVLEWETGGDYGRPHLTREAVVSGNVRDPSDGGKLRDYSLHQSWVAGNDVLVTRDRSGDTKQICAYTEAAR